MPFRRQASCRSRNFQQKRRVLPEKGCLVKQVSALISGVLGFHFSLGAVASVGVADTVICYQVVERLAVGLH